MKKIVVNKIRCKKCGDIIESKSVHDFVTCKCGAVSVDGGHNYIRRCGNLEDFEDLSEYEESVADAIRAFCEENSNAYSIYEGYSGRNMFGRKCLGAVIREGYSYLDFLVNLTQYLDTYGIDDADLEPNGLPLVVGQCFMRAYINMKLE